jgi:predicted DsbA family dithiol-disulfide isomerase
MGVFDLINMKSPVLFVSLACCLLYAATTLRAQVSDSPSKDMPMTIEIWSDIMCPFCYIGKTRLDKALKEFPHADKVNVVWKSFMLQPDMRTDTAMSIQNHLAVSKGISVKEAKEMTDYVVRFSAADGLDLRFDRVVVANTLRAHILLHAAGEQGKQHIVKGLLFDAYFTKGKNIDDVEVLLELALLSKMDTDGLRQTLEHEMLLHAVEADIAEASQLGVRGVPFFVFNGSYTLNGAQDSRVFLQMLEKSWGDYERHQANETTSGSQGKTCAPQDKCD